MGAWDLKSVEQAFADAAVDPSLWSRATEIAAEVTQSAGSLLFPHAASRADRTLPIIPPTPSLIAVHDTFIADGWSQRDERTRAWPKLLNSGVVTDLDIMTSDEMDRHPYYQDFLGPHGFRWFAGILLDNGEDHWCLSIQRSIAQGPFSSRETAQLAELSRRLGSAAALARAFGFAAMDAALEAYELSGLGVAVISSSGEVVRLNASAERLLGHGIAVAGKRLVTESTTVTNELDRELNMLIRADAGAVSPPIALPRRDRPPLLAYAVKLSTLAGNLFFEGQVLLVFVDPATRQRPPEVTLRRTWGLTPSEARLASHLATGERLETIADKLRITITTARKQLAYVFAKTGTHRQGELIALLIAALGGFF